MGFDENIKCEKVVFLVKEKDVYDGEKLWLKIHILF